MHPAITYTAGRIGLFLVAAGGLWFAGLDPFLALIGGMMISMVMSWFLLKGPRDAMSERIEASATRRRRLREEADAALDEKLGEPSEATPAAVEAPAPAEALTVPTVDDAEGR